jgi:hypothetical protein
LLSGVKQHHEKPLVKPAAFLFSAGDISAAFNNAKGMGESTRAVLVFTESVEPLYLFVLAAFRDAKPFHTFAGNALEQGKMPGGQACWSGSLYPIRRPWSGKRSIGRRLTRPDGAMPSMFFCDPIPVPQLP